MKMLNMIKASLGFSLHIYQIKIQTPLWYHTLKTESEIGLSLFSSTSVHEQTKVYMPEFIRLTSVVLHRSSRTSQTVQ